MRKKLSLQFNRRPFKKFDHFGRIKSVLRFAHPFPRICSTLREVNNHIYTHRDNEAKQEEDYTHTLGEENEEEEEERGE